MPTERKIEAVKELEEILSQCTIAIATDYRGLSVGEMSQLRQKLREGELQYKVIKNSLAHIAAERAGREAFSVFLKGPTAIAYSYGDVTVSAKILVNYIRTSRSILSIKGALLDQQVLSSDQVSSLAALPPRDVLISQVIRGIKGPMFALHSVLNNPLQQSLYSLHNVLSSQIRGLTTVLQARTKQLEGS